MKRRFPIVLLVAGAFLACNDAPTGVDDAPDEVGTPSFKVTTDELVESPQFSEAAAVDGTYLLTASRWRRPQTAAVREAGGTVVWSHDRTGMGVATSDDPDFLDNVMASGAFSSGEADQIVEWQPPVRVADVKVAAVTGGDETFFLTQWNMQAIEAPAAWAAGYDGTGARVAVIDGGINDTHGDLAGQVDVACSASFVPGFAFNQDVGGFWHGSHVAGIVAAADNNFGVIGVAPGATIMALKALHDGSGSFGAVIGAILFASDPASFGTGCTQRADIINMSLAGVFLKSSARGFQAATTKAVNFAASKGVLVISAAGNNGLDLGQFFDLTVIPAQSGSGLAISATGPLNFCQGATNFRRFASYSNYGEDLVTLAGPGGDFVGSDDDCSIPRTTGGPDVTFPTWVFDMVPAPCGGSGGSFTCWAAGTSTASPAAAGVAALIVGKNPGISLGKLQAKLKNSADDEGKVGKDEFYGHGFVNARRAVQ